MADVIGELKERIARGAFRAGDELPPITQTAKERVMSPRRVLDAYQALCREGIAVHYGEDVYMVSAEGPAIAQRWLLESASTQIADILNGLERAGCTREDLLKLMEELMERFDEE